MADIFISYASADREPAGRLARVLEGEGWSVWWDRKIPPGRSYAQVIEEALDAARCVLVLWSKTSVSSDWVHAEAAEGMRRRILFPAALDAAKIPLEFRRIQVADLSQWSGGRDHPEVEKLLGSIATVLGPSARSPSAEPTKREASGREAAPPPEPPRAISEPPPTRPPRKWLPYAVGAATAIVLALAWRLFVVFEPPPPPATDMTAALDEKPKADEGVRQRAVADAKAKAAEEERRATDDAAWALAETAGTRDAMQEYLKKAERGEIPGMHLKEARQLLAKFKRKADEGTEAKRAAEKPKSESHKTAVALGSVNLRAQSTYSSNDLRHTALLEVMSAIGTTSAGAVKMEVLPAGAVAPAFAAVEAVAQGTLNAAWISPLFNYGKDTAFGLVEGAPFGLDPGNYAAWRSNKEVNAIVERLYRRYGVVGLACGVTAPHGDIWVKKPIAKLEDLQGLKIRAIGMQISMFVKVGAAVNALPTGEVVPAMDRGLLDAAIVSDPRSDLTYDLPAVSKVYMVGQLQGARGLDLVINAGLWDGLQPDARNAIATACRSNLSKMVAESTRIASEAINEMKKTVKLYRLPNSVSDALRRAWNEVRSEEMAKNRTFSELAATMNAYDSAVQRPNLSAYGLNKP